jgi:CheY-like chemotaxis protein
MVIGRMCKVLVVSQDADLKERAAVSFSQQGCRVLCATNAIQGLNLARLALPDVIVLDDELSDLDRFGFSGILRAQPSTRGVPVIVLAAAGKFLLCQQLTALDARQPPQMPIEFEALGDFVTGCLARQIAPEAPGAVQEPAL